MPLESAPRNPAHRLSGAAALATLAIALGGVALWLSWSPLDANEVVGGDEGYYGTMARNILADPHQWSGPSLTPLGPPGDKPPLYPSLLAVSIRSFGLTPTALRWPSIAAALAIVLGLAWLASSAAGPAAGPMAAALMLALPWFADSSRVAAAEPMLTALGTLAIALAAGGSTRTRGAVAGLLLGLAFLCKLWLVALVALPVAAALWPAGVRRAAPLVLAVAVALLIAALQLVAVAVLAPESLAHWLRIDLAFSLAGRAGGGGFADYWLQPPGYYAALLGHALMLQLPLIALGLVWAVRRWREPVPRALLVWALGGAIVLSMFAVKSGVYAYVIMPAWVALAVLGALGLARGERPSWPALAIACVAGSPPVIARLGDRELPFAPWLAVWTIAAAAIVAARRWPRAAPWAAALLVAAAVGGGTMREAQRLPFRYHVPGYAAVRAALAPRLADVPPGRACFVSPEAPAFAFHLFRTGRYWGTPGAPWRPAELSAIASDTSLRAFVVDTERTLYGGWPDSSALAWLERSTREITGEIATADRPGRLRVFVRESLRAGFLPAARHATVAGRSAP